MQAAATALSQRVHEAFAMLKAKLDQVEVNRR
jgi:hypothetical protein